MPHAAPAGNAGTWTRTLVLLFLAYGTALFLFTAAFARSVAHSNSRLATIRSLVEDGTFAIPEEPFPTIDKVRIDGLYYSHQPPLQAVAGAVVYWPLRRLGVSLNSEHRLGSILLTFALNGVATLVTVFCFFRALRWSGLDPRWHLPLTAGLACGTLLLPFGTTLNSHGFAAALMMIGLYYFLRSAESGLKRDVFASGLAFGASAASEHATSVFYVAFAVCLLLRAGERSRLLWFLLPATITVLPTAIYYYGIGHSLTPFAARPELFAYPGSAWRAAGDPETRLTGASWNNLPFAACYGTSLLIGPRGFLVYNPTSILVLYGLGLTIWADGKHRAEAAAVALASTALIAYYALASSNYSGWSYSIRWFVPLLPIWWFFGAAAMQELMARRRAIVLGLAGLSLLYALAGVLNPWPRPGGYFTPAMNVQEFGNSIRLRMHGRISEE